MQQQQQGGISTGGGGGGGGGGGSQYGISPEMTPYLQAQQLHQHQKPADAITTTSSSVLVVEAASPISSRPPAGAGVVPRNFEDLMPNSSSGGGFQMEDDGVGGEEADRGISGGNRWPSHETNALLKIRSDMDTVFRDTTLKGPLWENVSRQLAELGYIRSAKKCKEKFENVHKYYKRTKESRAGRQDGKTYRYFSQLEAIQTPITTAVMAAVPVSSTNPIPVVSMGRTSPPNPMDTTPVVTAPIGLPPPNFSAGSMPTGLSALAAAGISFTSNTSSSSSGESEDDMELDPLNTDITRKRKRGSSSSSNTSSTKMMAFFQGLMKQVIEKQESMQQRFLEVIEKREQDRMIREEAWKRQEMARLSREHEIIAQERAISASRDAAIIAFLQKLTGHNLQLHIPIVIPAAAPPTPQTTPTPPTQVPPPPVIAPSPQPQPQPQPQPPIPARPPLQPQHHHPIHHHQLQQQKQQPPNQNTEIVRHHQQPTSSEMVVAAIPEQQHPPPQQVQEVGGSGFDSTSSRWPKTEVIALINLRSGLESRYQEAGPKGPLWEEISLGMQRMGYNRSSKRCKEKWENINKYFKKVKESNKKRPEDAKTCPYFHQLDALYRRKAQGSSSGVFQSNQETKLESAMAIDQTPTSTVAVVAPPPPAQTQKPDAEMKSATTISKNGGNVEVQTSNIGGGGTTTTVSAAAVMKKPEDIMKELMGHHLHHHHHHQQQQQQSVMPNYDKLEEADNSDNLDHEEEDYEDEEDDDDEETEEESKMGYKIQFQRPSSNNGSSSNGGGNTSAATATSSFLAMVQ
ncbi:hypothetical protein GIB67_033260 [Kingdonia uniflora]|uniref:Myb-like domain-containing protein n=1 Tax=Kingdonia uniflora TaxID=39325 RepID=A0A7J7MPI2_9MAGN|nr:hypothetical protein GIB67_033260 [Kingdonia uniflora]